MTDAAREIPFEQKTTYHVGRAQQGDPESVEWVVQQFTPLLLTSARYRLKSLREFYEPEDIVQDVWSITLPRLTTLSARDGRLTPVVVRFLSTTLVRRIRDLYRKHLENKPSARPLDVIDRESVSNPTTALLTRVLRGEEKDLVLEALDDLDEESRSVIILRGMEGLPYKEIEMILGRDHKALSVVYERAVNKLRRKLPRSIFDEFEAP